MTKKVIIALSVSLVLITAVIFAIAHEARSWTPEEIGNRVVKRMTDRLELTDAQVVELQRITDEIIEETAGARELRKDIRDELIVQFRSDNFDAKKVNAMIRNRAKDFNYFSGFFVEKTAEFHTLLTPEQREKFARGIEKHATRCPYDRENYLKTK